MVILFRKFRIWSGFKLCKSSQVKFLKALQVATNRSLIPHHILFLITFCSISQSLHYAPSKLVSVFCCAFSVGNTLQIFLLLCIVRFCLDWLVIIFKKCFWLSEFLKIQRSIHFLSVWCYYGRKGVWFITFLASLFAISFLSTPLFPGI